MASLSTTDIDNLTKSLLSNDNFLTIIQNVTPNAQPQAHRNTTRRPHQDLNSEMNSLFTTPSTRSRNTTRRRTQDNSRSRSCSNSRQNQNYFYLKEVILLDTSQSDQIPRANYYGKLDEKGHVYHHVELEQCMTAKEVYKKLENMFSDILEIESDPNKFEFMIGMGSRLTKLRLTDDQERNAQLLHRLYGNKRVYLLPSRDIVSTTNSNISDYLLPLSPTSDAKESDTEA
ncbi:uncharacterized protein [Antedon mediterranea]|uniref:uncharacterized protein n=1 Tax=Antedon mediterranea TaxID=105859 RepID=UPI003AF4333E